MAENIQNMKKDLSFSTDIPAFQPTEPNHAKVFNDRGEQLVSNDARLKEELETVKNRFQVVNSTIDGLCPKNNDNPSTYLNGQGNYTTPPQPDLSGYVPITGGVTITGLIKTPTPIDLTEDETVVNGAYVVRNCLASVKRNIADVSFGDPDAITDFNNAIQNGIYRIIPNVANQPPSPGGVWGSLLVMRSYAGALTQIVFEASSNSVVYNAPMYIRGATQDTNGNYIFTPWRSYHGDEPGTIITSAKIIGVSGCIYCSGQAVSRTTFPELFKAIGTNYGAGDGWSTFNVPDYRGVVLRGLDDGLGRDIDRPYGTNVGSYQDDAIRNITGSFIGGHGSYYSGAFSRVNSVKANCNLNSSLNDFSAVDFNAALQVPTASENRMKNIAVTYWIKY